jgi:hypothetical protein
MSWFNNREGIPSTNSNAPHLALIEKINETNRNKIEARLSAILDIKVPRIYDFELNDWKTRWENTFRHMHSLEDLQMLYAGDRVNYDIAMYLQIPLRDTLKVLKELIRQGDDLHLAKLIMNEQVEDANILFKKALKYERLKIAKFILPYCNYDGTMMGYMTDLLDEGKVDQAEDVLNLFESYQRDLKSLFE